MEKQTIRQLAAWLSQTINNDTPVTNIVTDSRKVTEGSAYLAIKGEHFNGHDFINSAIENGAVLIISEEQKEAAVPVLYVKDTIKAYGILAAAYLQSLQKKVIAVTGSVGKTTTKEYLAAVMGSRFKVTKTEGNLNNHIGLPQTVFTIGKETEAAILEMGMSGFGEIAYLSNIAKPGMSIITKIGVSHMEQLGSREGILQAKMEITEGMKDGATLILNGDDPYLCSIKGTTSLRELYVGITGESLDLKAENINQTGRLLTFNAIGLGRNIEVTLHTMGLHQVQNALFAIAAGIECGLCDAEIQQGLEDARAAKMRQQFIETEGGIHLINDCYNAAPESMEAALKVLSDYKASGKKIAVLGSMLELGTDTEARHEEVGTLAASTADILLTYGPSAAALLKGATSAGMKHAEAFTDKEALTAKLKTLAEKNDVLLFKGSRAMALEEVVEQFIK